MGSSQTPPSGSFSLHSSGAPGAEHSQPRSPGKLIPQRELHCPLDLRGSQLFPAQPFLTTNSLLLNSPLVTSPWMSQGLSNRICQFNPSPSCILHSSLFCYGIPIYNPCSLRVSLYQTTQIRSVSTSHQLNPFNGSETFTISSSHICYHCLASLLLPQPPHKCFPKCGTRATPDPPA